MMEARKFVKSGTDDRRWTTTKKINFGDRFFFSSLIDDDGIVRTMRRSKSDPAKYARNYRSISQRRMTASEPSADEEQKELQRLRKVLRESEAHLERSSSAAAAERHQQIEELPSPPAPASSRRKKRKHHERDGGAGDSAGDREQPHSILSPELLDEMSGGYCGGGGGAPENPLVIVGGGSKKKPQQQKKKARVALSPQEIREAKKLQKNAQRKLQQLQARAEQKRKRRELYAKLEQSALPKREMQLLISSSTLGKRQSKRERLSALLRKERAGIKLTEEERDLLYKDRDVPPPEELGPPFRKTDGQTNSSVKSATAAAKKATSSKAQVKPTATGIQKNASTKSEGARTEDDDNFEVTMAPELKEKANDECATAANKKTDDSKQSSSSDSGKKSGLSFAAQMMASLSKLKAYKLIKSKHTNGCENAGARRSHTTSAGES